MKLHRQIAKLFLGMPPTSKHQVHHINHCKKDNRVCNLMWVTQGENIGYYREFKKGNPGLDNLMRQEARKRREVTRLKRELEDIDHRIIREAKYKTYFKYPPVRFSNKKEPNQEIKASELLNIGVKVLDDAMYRIK